MKNHLPALLAAGLIALSGCLQFGDVGADAALSFDGTGNGSHSDSAACGSDGTLRGEGTVVHGSLRVRLTDGDGQTLHDQTHDGRIDMDPRSLTGHSGTWRLEATRSGELIGQEFDGQYLFRLDC